TASGAVEVFEVVMQRTARTQRYENHVALGRFGRLADRFRHFARLAVAEADAALLVADDDEGCKAETPAALDDLGDAVDVDELIDDAVVALFAIAATAAIPTFLCHILVPCSFPEARVAECRRLIGSPAAKSKVSLPIRAQKSATFCRPAPVKRFRSSGHLHGRLRPAP